MTYKSTIQTPMPLYAKLLKYEPCQIEIETAQNELEKELINILNGSFYSTDAKTRELIFGVWTQNKAAKNWERIGRFAIAFAKRNFDEEWAKRIIGNDEIMNALRNWIAQQ
jgi:hypothetical protein